MWASSFARLPSELTIAEIDIRTSVIPQSSSLHRAAADVRRISLFLHGKQTRQTLNRTWPGNHSLLLLPWKIWPTKKIYIYSGVQDLMQQDNFRCAWISFVLDVRNVFGVHKASCSRGVETLSGMSRKGTEGPDSELLVYVIDDKSLSSASFDHLSECALSALNPCLIRIWLRVAA